MPSKWKSGVLVALGVAIALPVGAPAVSAPAVSSDYDVTAAKNAEYAAATSLGRAQQELAALSARSDELEAQALAARERADQAVLTVTAAMSEAANAQSRVDAAQEKVQNARSQMAAVAQALYQDSTSRLASGYYFLDSHSFAAAHSRTRAYQTVMQHSDEQAQEFQQLEQAAENLQQVLKAKLSAADQAAREANDADAAAQSAAQAASEQVAQANKRRDELAVTLAQAHQTTVEAERKELARIEAEREAKARAAIAQAQAEKERAAALAKQRAEAQAAEKAAKEQKAREAAARQAAASSQSASSSSSASKPASTSQPTSTASSGGQARRDALVAYATQFEGTPYVWGGTSPTNGWDCSGFVQYVLRHFGIETLHGADWQGEQGRQVSAAEAKPGDFVWWPGRHIALYLGNGRTFGARDYEYGTGYSTLYSSYVFVRFIE
ncbi:MAG: NlpC/P60 family protein [Actinomycetaceae bacterium]|nr:NlpC/P60 family protein [Arcanobacterium sp.]MDD7687013.1 NlpC/P60 family protein [Actinomycetaceae bacterium]MDY5273331.1 NlpC/P60 family protein [Arcanobacterium sp.]